MLKDRKLLFAGVIVLSLLFLHESVWARAGGGRSFGSRGSRSSYTPRRDYSTSPSQQRPSSVRDQATPQSSPLSGGFFRGGLFQGLAGGILGGMLGGLLFRSLGFAGGGLGGGLGGGIGLFEILLMAAVAFGIYVFMKRRREAAYSSGSAAYQGSSLQDVSYNTGTSSQPAYGTQGSLALKQDLDQGLSNIRQMDPGFDEPRFQDHCSDLFFKVQAGWINRDLEALRPMLTGEMAESFRSEFDQSKREGKINRMENIAVRSVEICEAWQEQGSDFITVRFYANLLDYTVDEKTSQVVSGSKTEPVKFEEYWTFTRPVGPNPWKLSAIEQAS